MRKTSIHIRVTRLCLVSTFLFAVGLHLPACLAGVRVEDPARVDIKPFFVFLFLLLHIVFAPKKMFCATITPQLQCNSHPVQTYATKRKRHTVQRISRRDVFYTHQIGREKKRGINRDSTLFVLLILFYPHACSSDLGSQERTLFPPPTPVQALTISSRTQFTPPSARQFSSHCAHTHVKRFPAVPYVFDVNRRQRRRPPCPKKKLSRARFESRTCHCTAVVVYWT